MNTIKSDGPSTTKCPGCQRLEVHKHCPAYGTVFYMSGFEFTKEIEEAILKVKNCGFPDIDVVLLNILKGYS